jgi:hypothetical protein
MVLAFLTTLEFPKLVNKGWRGKGLWVGVVRHIFR